MSELSSENQVLRPAKKRHGVWRIERAFARSYSFAEFGWRRWRLWRLAAVCRLDWHEVAEDERSRGGRYPDTLGCPSTFGDYLVILSAPILSVVLGYMVILG